jgi:hypothetical protein
MTFCGAQKNFSAVGGRMGSAQCLYYLERTLAFPFRAIVLSFMGENPENGKHQLHGDAYYFALMHGEWGTC